MLDEWSARYPDLDVEVDPTEAPGPYGELLHLSVKVVNRKTGKRLTAEFPQHGIAVIRPDHQSPLRVARDIDLRDRYSYQDYDAGDDGAGFFHRVANDLATWARRA